MLNIYEFPPEYLPFWHLGTRVYLNNFVSFLRNMKTAGKTTVLDVGAGAGWQSLVSAHEGFMVTSIDSSENVIRRLQNISKRMNLDKNIRAVAADCYNLPLGPDQFDIVIAAHIIEHLDRPSEFITELARVVRPGGCILLSCPSRNHSFRLSKWLGMKLDPPDHKVIGYDGCELSAMLPQALQAKKIFYQARVIESNLSDVQALLAKLTGARANPLDEKSLASANYSLSLWVFWALKELILLPSIFLSKIENRIFPFLKGSSLTMELIKTTPGTPPRA